MDLGQKRLPVFVGRSRAKGFLVEGKRTFIVSGSMHYPRVPRALWRDRLLRIKRGWGGNKYEQWLVGAMTRELLPAGRARAR